MGASRSKEVCARVCARASGRFVGERGVECSRLRIRDILCLTKGQKGEEEVKKCMAGSRISNPNFWMIKLSQSMLKVEFGTKC